MDERKKMPENMQNEPPEIEGKYIAITNESELPVPMTALYERVERLYKHIGEAESEVSIVLMTDEDIRELNKEWRDLDESTDVLSFPMREGEDEAVAKQLPLGDIAISVETAMRYVESCNHRDRVNENGPEPLKDDWSLLDELSFLVIHSTLHLLGYDHAEPEEEKVMRDKEREWMMFLISNA